MVDATLLIQAAALDPRIDELRKRAVAILMAPVRFVLTNLVVLEAVPKRLVEGGERAETVINTVSNAHIVSVSDAIVATAFRLAYDHNLTGIDAVALATARRVDVDLLVTDDHRLLDAAPDIARKPEQALAELMHMPP